MLELKIIYTILVGIIFGIMVGITGLFPGGFIALILYYLGVFPDLKLSLGTVIFLLALPFSIGGTYEYHKSGKIEYKIGMGNSITLLDNNQFNVPILGWISLENLQRNIFYGQFDSKYIE